MGRSFVGGKSLLPQFSMSSASPIRSISKPNCAVCGRKGDELYSDLIDRLFGASGTWNLKRCSNPECGLIWLDPMPLAEDIWMAYASYYTHTTNVFERKRNWPKRVVDSAKHGYWAREYGYQVACPVRFEKFLGAVTWLFPIRRREFDAEIRLLPAVANGRLLDLGCGSGGWLRIMRELGWQVEGLDFDENAVKAAREHGLKVFLGSLEQQRFPDNTFDAITLSHVIEHVPDPTETLRECLRILKPAGRIVLITPNGASLSHLLFKESWRGLEPPRHLHIFSMEALQQLLVNAGFIQVSVRPFIVTSVIYESFLLRFGRAETVQMPIRNKSARVFTLLFKFFELCLLPFHPSVGDCVIANALKR